MVRTLLTTANHALNALHTLDTLDFLQNALEGILRLDERLFVGIRRPLETPFASDGVKLHVRSDLQASQQN
jgi:hypothetical protein